MSSMKKNILAVALVAGLGMAGAAAAYNYGTDPARSVPESVAYQQLFSSNNYTYTMTQGIVFDIDPADNIVNYTQGFTVRVKLNRMCSGPAFGLVGSTPSTCVDTADGALFDVSNTPSVADMVLDPTLVADWDVRFDAYYDGGLTASFRITPKQGVTNPTNPSSGTMLTWKNARLTSLGEFASNLTSKVDAEFWMINPSNDARFVDSTKWGPILARTSGITACATGTGAETDKFIDVADRWTESTMPKSRFSFDGKLGSALDTGYDSQWIDLGDVTITNNGAGNFAFIGTDLFTTVISGGASDNWLAFDNDHLNGSAPYNDDVWLSSNGTCTNAGAFVARGEVEGNTVTFKYTAAQAGLSVGLGPFTTNFTVCGFVDSDVVIDDHNNTVTTTFFRANAIPTPIQAGTGCALLPLRYNGSTMEIFTINPGSNVSQRSFIRLSNRSATDGYVSLVGIDDQGHEGASQVRVWVPAGASVQLNATDLENGGTQGAIGAWGVGSGKWRAVVTAEFPGLVATSLVNSTGRVLANLTDSDTRGEQYGRDYDEGNFANAPGERASDFAQETTPDFRGNGESTGQPGGPNGSDGPAGGTTNPCGNEGNGSGNAQDGGHDQSNEDPYCYGP